MIPNPVFPSTKSELDSERNDQWTQLQSFLPCHASPEPFPLSIQDVEWFRRLGPCLLSFYRAKDRLYQMSVNGEAPGWVAGYLDNGKPEAIVALGRARAFRDQLPAIIRPDVLLLPDGYSICELDAVPGGFGLAARMADCYRQFGHNIAGDISIEAGFLKAMQGNLTPGDGVITIVVSDESAFYRDEMEWLAVKLQASGHSVHVAHPRDLHYTDKNVSMLVDGQQVTIDVLYRFLELHDLPNVSKSDLLLYLAKGKRVRLTAPPKAYLEEKMWLAFFHHPSLQDFWRDALGERQMQILSEVFPQSWIVDPTPLPGHVVIPGLKIDGDPVQDWKTVAEAGKANRRLVLKPSGFSEIAWGSRGVVIGHDGPAAEWANAMERALVSYPKVSWVLQRYNSPVRRHFDRYDANGKNVRFEGRVRLTPYYFVQDGEAKLSTILATICSSDKKKIHGMQDAVMTVCSAP